MHQVEHHLAHLASAFLVSPFEEAVVVSVDGFGDFAQRRLGRGARHARSTSTAGCYFPHSLGIFYQALTQYLGFPHYGDEYKVMGLAPYGEPALSGGDAPDRAAAADDGGFELDLRYFRHHREKVAYEWDGGIAQRWARCFAEALVRPARPGARQGRAARPAPQDIARSVQAMYEEAFFHLLERLHARYRLDAVALAGGCAMNSVANGKVAPAHAVQAGLRPVGGGRRGRRDRRGRPPSGTS